MPLESSDDWRKNEASFLQYIETLTLLVGWQQGVWPIKPAEEENEGILDKSRFTLKPAIKTEVPESSK